MGNATALTGTNGIKFSAGSKLSCAYLAACSSVTIGRFLASAQTAHVPPPLPPTLFAAPEKHQVVPGVRPPEARSDLVDIIRVCNDHVSERTANSNTTHLTHHTHTHTLTH